MVTRDRISGRLEDAKRVRQMWLESLREQPNVPEDKRIRVLTTELAKRTPGGALYYLASFRKDPPTQRWVRSVLRGSFGAKGQHAIGDSLLAKVERGSGTRVADGRASGQLYARVKHLEAAVRVLCSREGLSYDAFKDAPNE